MKRQNLNPNPTEKALILLGLTDKQAMVLNAIGESDGKLGTIEIERKTLLRQPEVSLTMKDLFTLGYVSSKDENTPGKGRPSKIYSLRRPISEIIKELRSNKEQALKNELQAIHQALKAGTATPKAQKKIIPETEEEIKTEDPIKTEDKKEDKKDKKEIKNDID